MAKLKNLLIFHPVDENFKDEIVKKLPETKILYRTGADLTQADIREADAIFGNVPVEMLSDAPNLKWIHLGSAGTDGYTPVLDRGIALSNGTGAYNDTIAEHMLAFTGALCIGLPRYARQQQAHHWECTGWSRYIMDSTIAILGCGNIGSAYARRVHALGAYTIGVRRSVRSQIPEGVDEMVSMAELDSVLPRADIVAMVMPNTPETRGIMDARRIGLMKDGALLINVGRGNALDPDALYDGLVSGKLGAAAIDVAYTEPLPEDDKLWDAPNLLITPHIAGGWNGAKGISSPAMARRIGRVFFENLDCWLADRPLKNAVDPATGYTKHAL